ncbi:MAG: hypothetical protein KAI24_00810 [Planctomycetes bacterium]|nr:hypothetical protein [Planctomycetota bacterium]
MNQIVRLAVPMLGAILLSGCAGTSDKLADQTCVMMPGEPVFSDSRSAEFDGRTVRFCCASCARKWDKKSDAEKRQLIADCDDYLGN